MPASGTIVSAPNRVVRIRLRRPKPLSLAPVMNCCRTFSLTWGSAETGCRWATISSSDISVRAQCTAPRPMPSSAVDRVRPSEKFSALTCPIGKT